jgi:hypothetical protein
MAALLQNQPREVGGHIQDAPRDVVDCDGRFFEGDDRMLYIVVVDRAHCRRVSGIAHPDQGLALETLRRAQ